jgi:hypothetical protein
MKILLNSDSVAIFVGLNFTLTPKGLELPGAFSAQCTTANCTVIEVEPPPHYVSNAYKRENNAWLCIDQPAVDAYLEQQKETFNASQKEKRSKAYAEEADPMFFKAQRGEATTAEWEAKVAEIKARFPYQQ